MKNLLLLTLLGVLLFVAQSQIEVTGEPPYNYQTQSAQKGYQVDTYIPSSLNADLKEVGYSFWIKGNYVSPKYMNFGHLHGNWPAIAHICDNTYGSCSGAVRHRFLALWQTNSNHQGQDPKYHFSSYQTNNGNPWQNMKFPGGRDDYDHVWNFISFSYSFVEQRATAITYFGNSQETAFLEWKNNVKHQPIQLKFRIGGCNQDTGIVFQGSFHDVNLQYSTTQSGAFIGNVEDFHRYRSSRFTPTDSLYAYEINNVLSGGKTYRIGQDGNINRWSNLNGLEEYAVWGWAKWDYTRQKKAWHLLYRFSGLKEADVQNMSKLGDRTLACWVGNGYLHFSTYDFNWHGGHRVNIPQNINYGEDLTNWFFVYQGYSYKEKKVFAYVKFQGKEETKVWEDNFHMKPDDVTFQLGKDQWHSTFNGDLENWNVALNTGFRTENFEELYNQEKFTGDDENELIEPSEPAAELIDSVYDDKEVYKYTVPEEELGEVEDTSYSFWFRFNYYEPKPIHLGWARGRWLALASLSENDKCSTGVNDRWQSIWLQHLNVGEPRLHFTTYAQNKGNWNYWQNMVFEDPLDLDSSWNFLYYGYSHKTQKLFAYVKFGRSGNVQTLSWEPSTHTNPPPSLTFRLGQCQQSNMGFNGHFWNPRFYYKGDNYLGTKQAVDAYFLTSAKPTSLLPPAFKTVNLVNGEKRFDAKPAEGEEVIVGPIDGVSGAEEYGIYGWAKWEYIKAKAAWHIVYRHNNYDPETYTNMNKFGDRDQTMWVGNGYLHTSTYNSNIGGGDNWNMPKNSNYEDDLESWFWFYQGYSYKHRKSFFYVKYAEDRVITQVWENNGHQLPSQPWIYLGKDKFHQGFNGYMKDVNAVYGPGAYRETNFEEWQAEEIIEPQFDNDQFWDQEPEVEKSQHDNHKEKDWYEIEAPKEELANIKEYSFSAYVKLSMADPVRAGVGIARNNWRGIMGITEKDQFCTHNQPGYRTLALYDSHWTRAGAPSYHFTTYATNKNNNNIWKDISYGEDQDVDGSWNWVYFGYSLEEQKAFAYVKFGRSGLVKTETWDHVAHAQDIESLKLMYGNCGGGYKGFHGSFYDVRFRWDNMAFKGWEAHATHYLKNSVPTSPFTRPAYSRVPLTDGQETFQKDQDLADPLEFPVKYSGAEEYAIYGWSKWTYTKQKAAWHLLFRVQVNENGQNIANLGDRTLTCWVGNGYLHFSTYHFDLKSQRQVNNYKNIKYNDDLDSWFFVYFGYNWNQRRAIAYVKFQDRTETVQWENTRHFIPHMFRIQLGNDQWYKAFNGQMRGWYFNVGQGAFRDGEFDQLYNQKPWSSNGNIQTGQLRPSSEDIVKPGQESLAPEQVIIDEDKLADIKIYGYWGWTRWSFRSPGNYAVNQFKNKCYSIARAVAVKGQGITTSLCVRPNKSVFYKFCDTYAKTCLDFNTEAAISDVFDQWVWVYYAHNQHTKENVAYVYFDSKAEGTAQTQASTVQPDPLPRLNFKVGGRQEGEHVFNGFIFDDEFQTGEGAWVNADQEGALDAFRAQKANPPADLNGGEDLSNNTVFIPVKEHNEFNVDQNADPANSSKLVNDYKSVREYCVFGWTKVHAANLLGKTPWITFFRLTINRPENLNNLKNIGDRTLNVWIHRNLSMAYVSYDFNFPANADINRHAYTPQFTAEDLTSGFFFTYMAYSPKLNKVFLYIQLHDGRKHEIPVDGVEQIAASHFGLYLGVDFNGTKNYKNLDAKFSYWHIGLGKGAYAETEEEMEIFKQIATSEGYDADAAEDNVDETDGEEEQLDNDDDIDACVEGQQCNDENSGVDNEEQPDNVQEEEQDDEDEEDNTSGVQEGNQGQSGGAQQGGEESGDDDDDDEGSQGDQGENQGGDSGAVEESDPQNCDDIEYVPNDPEQAPAPEGECVILYSECNFKGQWEEICDKSPKVFIDVKSVYIPEGLRIKLFNLPCFEGKTAIFHATVPCLDTIDFNLLQKSGIKLLTTKKANLLGGLKKKTFIKAHVLHEGDHEY